MARKPYFPLYVNDFAADPVVEAMTTEQVGAYILLLCKAWAQNPQGTIPADDTVLARWTRLTGKRWLAIKSGVLLAFKPIGDGRLMQKRMTEEAARLAAKSDLARESAEHRWGCERNANASNSHDIGICGPHGVRNARASASVSESGISESLNKQEPGGGGLGAGEIEPAAELAQLWSFYCTRRTKFGEPADPIGKVIDSFGEMLRVGKPFPDLKAAIEDKQRYRNEHLWQFESRLMGDRAAPPAKPKPPTIAEQIAAARKLEEDQRAADAN